MLRRRRNGGQMIRLGMYWLGRFDVEAHAVGIVVRDLGSRFREVIGVRDATHVKNWIRAVLLGAASLRVSALSAAYLLV